MYLISVPLELPLLSPQGMDNPGRHTAVRKQLDAGRPTKAVSSSPTYLLHCFLEITLNGSRPSATMFLNDLT